jgi:thiaminase (transcriptional activator TenA)
MAKDVDKFKDPNTLFGRLRSACADEWERYCNHEFVRHIGDGTLPEQCFRHYLEQDYLFLIHFSRAYALAASNAETLADMRAAASTLNAILNYETNLQVKYCSGWGLTEQEMERKNEARANMAYTRYVLHLASSDTQKSVGIWRQMQRLNLRVTPMRTGLRCMRVKSSKM